MSIPAQTIYNQLNSLLDAEGSNYYDLNLDIIPAINRAQKYIVSIINSVLGSRKFAEEHYRELTKVLIFQTSQYSRVDLTPTQTNYILWDVLSVVANPTLDIPFSPVSVTGNLSVPLPLRFYVSGGDPCQRTNAMEAVTNRNNPFEGGYSLEPTGKNLKYAYIQYSDYFNGINAVPNEIEINPYVPIQPIAVFVVIMPPDITTLASNLLFPPTFQDIITKAAFREISIKQGDSTTAFQVASQDIQTYIRSLA
jgi:hypothetical protein